MQNLAIIGSTGSVGRQTIDVVRKFPDLYKISALACNNNLKELIPQILEFSPDFVCVFDEDQAKKLKTILPAKFSKSPIYSGQEGLLKIAKTKKIQKVFYLSDGLSAAESLFESIKNQKQIAIANKELIVAHGPKIMKLAKQNLKNSHALPQIIPIDSEHSAIFQCLQGEDPASVDKVIITCSGGPFYGYTESRLQKVTLAQTLNHPTWRMGDEITVNSATLMNKAFEIIEAAHLFNLNPAQIEVVIHPESIIHSLVYFKDGSVKAQMSAPDMRHAIAFALNYPARLTTNLKILDLLTTQKLSFLKPDFNLFKGPKIAFDLLNNYSSKRAIKLIKANQQAVKMFLNKEINFDQIYPQIKRLYE